MSTDLSPVNEQFIQQAVQSGELRDRHAVIDEAIRIMREREEKRQALQEDIDAAHQQFLRGEYTPLDAEDIKRRGRERLEFQEPWGLMVPGRRS